MDGSMNPIEREPVKSISKVRRKRLFFNSGIKGNATIVSFFDVCGSGNAKYEIINTRNKKLPIKKNGS